MNLNNKMIASVLVASIGLSLFVGAVTLSAHAEPPTNPISHILEILLGIQPQITNIENKVNDLDNLKSNCLILNKSRFIAYIGTKGDFRLLMMPEGMVCNGHISLLAAVNDTVRFEVYGGFPLPNKKDFSRYGYVPIASGDASSPVDEYVVRNVEFNSMYILDLNVRKMTNDDNAAMISFAVIIQYENCTNITTLPPLYMYP